MNPAAPTTSAQALTNLNNYAGTMQDPSQILTQQQNTLGVPAAQQQLTGLQGAIANTTKVLNQVAPSVMGRTANSLVTSAQAGKQVQNESAPVTENLNKENTDYGNQQTTLNQLNSEADNAANLEQQGQQGKLSYLQGLYNSLYGQESDAAKAAEQAREFNTQEADTVANNAANRAASSAASGSDAAALQAEIAAMMGKGGGLPQGMSLKDTNAGGTSGYNFSFGGTPVSAASFAKLNNLKLGDTLFNMAQSGDKTAGQAYQAILANNGSTSPAIRSKYSSLFWGS